ncbi:serine/threonine-protein kinase [Chondromyces apiculatus]|uniref:Serine/threonine protein kinase PksC n=1 Tax=Chondromyces apiculatus DSM 436 TaxID=1192034 RepID=A0A017SWJ1_9BACT|nr:serine/threonine-protein kinase [Chondromyces apiculatus]EYF01339.1 serine/threonine protein kinase PksC [Chondromyces apiculatus DSM 436]
MQINAGTIIDNKYRLERPLSRGGMGMVWVARHARLGSPVAVKFMDAAFASSSTFVARFEREARIAANLQSPHVVHVQDYGIDGGVPYLVMELLQGEDLGSRLDRERRMSLPQAAQILSQVGKALRRAHESGLVHRDLKPGNIFLARVDDEEIAKVLDFGIVKEAPGQLKGEATQPGEVLGSPHYMSPEQVLGESDVDHRSDLWALGVILFKMLTGTLPFPGDQLGAVMGKILTELPPQATRVAPDLPAAMDGFFARALVRDRKQRFQSVMELVDALRIIAGTGPMSPRGPAERSTIHSWTNEVGSAAGGGGAGGAAGGVAAATTPWSQPGSGGQGPGGSQPGAGGRPGSGGHPGAGTPPGSGNYPGGGAALTERLTPAGLSGSGPAGRSMGSGSGPVSGGPLGAGSGPVVAVPQEAPITLSSAEGRTSGTSPKKNLGVAIALVGGIGVGLAVAIVVGVLVLRSPEPKDSDRLEATSQAAPSATVAAGEPSSTAAPSSDPAHAPSAAVPEVPPTAVPDTSAVATGDAPPSPASAAASAPSAALAAGAPGAASADKKPSATKAPAASTAKGHRTTTKVPAPAPSATTTKAPKRPWT